MTLGKNRNIIEKNYFEIRNIQPPLLAMEITKGTYVFIYILYY